MNKFYNGGFAPGISVSMLKESIALVQDYVSKTRKSIAKPVERHIWKLNMKSFSNEKLNLFFRKFCCSYVLDLPKTVRAPWILLKELSRNSFKHLRTMHLWIYYFAPVISQKHIKYTLVPSSKLLACLFNGRLI